MLSAVLPLLLAVQVPDSVRPIPADAYPDQATAAFVARLRAARDRNERLVTSYTAVVRQRIGVGIRALSRDRMLYRQEVVARIDWRRDTTSTIEVLGAREGVPVAIRGDRLPEDLEDDLSSLVINPAQDHLRLLGGGSSNDGFVYPLREGGEADYRYEAGDTTTISLPNGRTIRLAALRIIPRRSDWRLLAGTLWFDADSHGLVQMVVRPARPYEFRRDANQAARRDVPAFVNPVGEVRYITIEYGLYEARWWLPRYIALDAVGTMGSWLGLPVRIERVYQDYEVEGGTPPPEGSTFRPAGTIGRAPGPDATAMDSAERQRRVDSVRVAIDVCVADAMEGRDPGDRARANAERRRCRRQVRDPSLTVVIPSDTAALLTHPDLGPPILAMGDLIDEAELGGLARSIGQLPAPAWERRLDLPDGIGAVLRHARYNRIEALSLGVSGRLVLGTGTVQGLARIGVADLVPNGEVGYRRTWRNGRGTLTGYRRLAAANPDTRPHGFINSTLGLLAQRDDGEYYRTMGVELMAENTNAGWWSARAYVQRERPARVETSASLPHLFDGDRAFRPNIAADSADQVGAALTVRGTRALSRAVTLGGEVTVDGAMGDFDFGRGSATLRVFVTPAGPLAWAASASAGTSTGTLPVQSRFYLGGASTLRGYAGGVAAGTAYWAGRLEMANSFPGARLALFSDAGWAGDRADVGSGRPLFSTGVGASFLDGLVRVDLARGLRAPTGWRMEFYLDGIL